MKLPFSCINTHILSLIDQYLTGLFVSYITHGKTQLYKSIKTAEIPQGIKKTHAPLSH